MVSAPDIKREAATSSRLVTNENSTDEIKDGFTTGSTTWINAFAGEHPMLMAASSRFGFTPPSPELMVTNTIGKASRVCVSICLLYTSDAADD